MSAPEQDARRLRAALDRMDLLVDWERRDRRDWDRDLEPVKDLLARLGDPHRRFRAVHVSGTKGKGSTCAWIAAGLQRAGHRTGVYASPHVEHPSERVRIDGRGVADAVLAEGLESALDAREAGLAAGTPAGAATWFDLFTAAAFWIFAAEGVEWAAVEVGLGGRLDSTNALDGELCVLTNVDLEHTAVLGDRLDGIAVEKGSIVPESGVLLTGVRRGAPEDDPLGALERLCAERGARLVVVPLTGPLRERNRELAAVALDLLGEMGVHARDGAPLTRALLDEEAARLARIPGRWEDFRVGGTPVHLDAAHVAGSLQGLLGELEPRLPGRPSVVLALGKDKQHAAVLKTLLGRVDRVWCTTSRSGPLLSAEELAERARAVGLEAVAEPDPGRALAAALEASGGGGWVLVTGSFYLAGELRPSLTAAAQTSR
ncbi:MAG: bifunctional folylpolyglutamate synthase/dihydrofolate synthase [Planctomycetes bacterium]|nr:bifunctional folylpolyglutamate synthase/dihydrofolate synthase [Planctomycetota bacterium]MCB9904951.1 bifunctional folylpolyglutamate synthase/dihydrofolate synthase [Planctomycetota bacterium]